jgi:WD40 repeat protein
VFEAKDLGVRQLDDTLVQSPNGRTLAVGAGVEAVLLDRDSFRPKAYLSGQNVTAGLAFSHDSRRLAASGEHLVVWDVTGPEPIVLLRQESNTDQVNFSPDGNTVYTNTAALLQAWDLTGERRFISTRAGEALGWPEAVVRFSPDRTKVGYVVHGPPQFRVRDLATGKLGSVVAPDMEQRPMIDIAWHPDSTTLNITTGAPEVRTWDANTGRQLAVHRLGPPGSLEGASIAFFSLDGKYLLVGTTTGRLHVLDARSLVPVRDPIPVYDMVQDQPREISDFNPSGDGHRVYLTDRIVDYRTGAVRTFPKLGATFEHVYPSPDGTRLLVDAGAAGVGLLDARTMHWISKPDAAQARMLGYMGAFSDDGSRFASLSDDSRLSYWDSRTGALLGSLQVDDGGTLAFSKDGSTLLLASQSGTVRSWNLDVTSWTAAACRLAGRGLTEQEWHNYLPNRPYRPICKS